MNLLEVSESILPYIRSMIVEEKIFPPENEIQKIYIDFGNINGMRVCIFNNIHESNVNYMLLHNEDPIDQTIKHWISGILKGFAVMEASGLFGE